MTVETDLPLDKLAGAEGLSMIKFIKYIILLYVTYKEMFVWVFLPITAHD